MHDIAHTDEGKGQYYWVWGALLFLTAVEVILAYEQVLTPLHMLEVLMVLSVIKAALIIAYFMHLKFEVPIMRFLLMASIVVCLSLMCIFFADAARILSLGVR
ncbi:MAG: cytochrome C oxidase subunit IV family protein [Terriglobales bacterium]|jgi:cytochrome c oxidase subunit IV